MPVAAIALMLAAAALATVVGHHIGYFRGRRPPTFGAFLETAGWLILFLVAIAAPSAVKDPGLVRVEIAAGFVGLLCVLGGWRLRKRVRSRVIEDHE